MTMWNSHNVFGAVGETARENMIRKACCPKEGINKGAWTSDEDKQLRDYIAVHGLDKWGSIPKKAGLKRCGKSCRLRWLNYLRPDIKRGNITEDEEELIARLHKLLGNRWSLIAGRIPGRTDNEIKNYWNTCLKKKNSGECPKQRGWSRTKKTPVDKSGMDNSTNVIQSNGVLFTESMYANQASPADGSGYNQLKDPECSYFLQQLNRKEGNPLVDLDMDIYRMPKITRDSPLLGGSTVTTGTNLGGPGYYDYGAFTHGLDGNYPRGIYHIGGHGLSSCLEGGIWDGML